MANDKVYIHELIDIVGHNRNRYLHHMTANWVPVALEERGQRCFGVWATVGSTGRWPEVVNLWELDGWDGLVANFEHEFAAGRTQDPALAEWWAVAADLRRGGVDRILVPALWSSPIEELVAEGVRGEVYAHELVSVRPGASSDYLSLLEDVGLEAAGALGARLVGAFEVAMRNDDECVVIWAFDSWSAWAGFESNQRSDRLVGWRKELDLLDARWQRWAMVDAPLAPLRLGRQPAVGDRRPLDEIG